MKNILVSISLILIISFNLNAQNSEAQTKSTSEPYLLPPFPSIPAKKQLNSVPMGDWKTFSEMKLNIPITPGPFKPTWKSIVRKLFIN